MLLFLLYVFTNQSEWVESCKVHIQVVYHLKGFMTKPDMRHF